jgi:diketogulonate reductase-like aldo/keto reductase
MTDDAVHLPDDTAALSNGSTMPLLGFDTWQVKGADAVRVSAGALQTGYRHLDTAAVYGNEGEVGRALSESGV